MLDRGFRARRLDDGLESTSTAIGLILSFWIPFPQASMWPTDTFSMANPPTRFDRIVKAKSHNEEAAREALSAALREADLCEKERDDSYEAAFSEERDAGDCANWALADLSHMRALGSLGHAEEKLLAAQGRADQARTGHTSAYRDLRVFERLVENRRASVLNARRRAEQKELDELALMLHAAGGYRGI